MKNKHLTFLARLKPALTDLAILAIAFFSALSLSPLFQLPFSNPNNISNPLNTSGFNPSNNYTTILFIIIATLILGFLFKKLLSSRFAWTLKIIAIIVLSINFSFSNIFDTYPAYIAIENGYVDEFHAGEQLSPAHAFLNGSVPYSEILFLRGLGVDVLFPAIGMSILGESISNFSLLSELTLLIGLGSFLLLLAFLIRSSLLYWLVSLAFYISAGVSIIEFRDVITWLFIGLLFWIFKAGIKSRTRNILLFAIGVTSITGMFVSIDRGIGILASTALLGILLSLFSVVENNVFKFNPKQLLSNVKKIIYLPIGLMTGVITALLFLRWDAFIAFIQMSFFEIPKFGGLLVSQPYPSLSPESVLFWTPAILAIICAYTLYVLWTNRSIRNNNVLIPFTVLLVLSLLFLKIGSNRIALAKLASATTPLFLLAILLLIVCIGLIYKYASQRHLIVIPTTLLIIVIPLFMQLQFPKLITQPQFNIHDARQYMKLIKLPDNHWVSPRTQAVQNYIQSKTTEDQTIFSFTSNPFYYYVADRQNASRFFISWFTDPQPYTNELLTALKENPPAVIIYEDTTWMDMPDNISMKERIPEVDKWITSTYQKHTIIEGVVILEMK